MTALDINLMFIRTWVPKRLMGTISTHYDVDFFQCCGFPSYCVCVLDGQVSFRWKKPAPLWTLRGKRAH